jgi:hypothetical protein
VLCVLRVSGCPSIYSRGGAIEATGSATSTIRVPFLVILWMKPPLDGGCGCTQGVLSCMPPCMRWWNKGGASKVVSRPRGWSADPPPSMACGPSPLVWGHLGCPRLGICWGMSIWCRFTLHVGPWIHVKWIWALEKKHKLIQGWIMTLRGVTWIMPAWQSLVGPKWGWPTPSRVTRPWGVVHLAPLCLFSLLLRRNTPWTCGTSYWVKYTHDICLSPFIPRLLMVILGM